VIDSKILGSLQGKAEGAGQTQFYLLAASAVLKLFLAQLTFQHARLAYAQVPGDTSNPYRRNARGAKIATIACLAATVAILAFAYKQAF
jgi:hypothetical protein